MNNTIISHFRNRDTLVQEEKGELWTNSLIISDSFCRDHKNVLRSIDQLIEDGTIGRRNFAPSSYLNEQNKPQRMIQLDERGFLIAMPFIGGRKSREGQVLLVDAFLKLRKQLTQKTEETLTRTQTRLATIEEALYCKNPAWRTIHSMFKLLEIDQLKELCEEAVASTGQTPDQVLRGLSMCMMA
ncbi:MAG: Rha family transcriptional regulator, partial [Magnetococcus sp. DMHC-6]